MARAAGRVEATVVGIQQIYHGALKEERSAAQRAAAKRSRGGRRSPRGEVLVGGSPNAEPGATATTPQPTGADSVATGFTVALMPRVDAAEVENEPLNAGIAGSPVVVYPPPQGVAEELADGEGGLPASLNADALAPALVDVGVGGRPSLNDENLEEGQRQSLATLLERDNPLFTALVETGAFKELVDMTDSAGGEQICEDLDTCGLCIKLNMAPVICRTCGNACCLPCVIQRGKCAGGDVDNVKCLCLQQAPRRPSA